MPSLIYAYPEYWVSESYLTALSAGRGMGIGIDTRVGLLTYLVTVPDLMLGEIGWLIRLED